VTARRSGFLLSRRTLCWCLVIYGLALAVRLVYYWQVHDNPLYDWTTLDENTNHHAALAHLKGTAPAKAYLKAPLYLYYLLGVYGIAGPETGAARLIQVFLASLWAPLTFLIAERLFGRPTDVLAGLLAAIFWTFVFFSTELLDVAIGGVFYLLTACLLIRLSDAYRWKWLLCGVALGLGAITRPNILAAAPFLAATVVLVAWRGARPMGTAWALLALRRAAGLALGCCLIVLPITVRNRVVGGKWVLIGAYGGVNFYLANNVDADAKNVELLGLPDYQPSGVFDANDPYNVHCFTYRQGCDYTSQKLGRPCTRGEMNDAMFALGRAYVRDHPGKFITDSLKRLCWFFNAYEFADNKDLYQFRHFSRLLSGLSLLHFGVLCPLIVFGLVLAIRADDRSPGLAYYLVLLASLIGPGVFFLVNARFRVTIVCLLAPLGAYGLVRVAAWCRASVDRRKTFIAAACLAGVGLVSNLNVFAYRPPCHPYLLFIYAAACGATGRGQEMARTVEKIEQAMAMDVKGGRHGRALYCLHDYYDRNGPLDKAVHYGIRLIERRQLDANGSARVFDTFMKANRPDLIRSLLAVMDQGQAGADPGVIADAILRYARRYHDRKWLRQAERRYRQLAVRHPVEVEYHRRLDLIRALLASPTTTRQATSAPTTSP